MTKINADQVRRGAWIIAEHEDAPHGNVNGRVVQADRHTVTVRSPFDGDVRVRTGLFTDGEITLLNR